MMCSDDRAGRGLPTVTVLIPCWREAAMIGRVVESALASEYQPEHLEILVLDGMSDDETRDIVSQLAARDSRVRMLDNPRRVIPAALNLGIAQARGNIIVRMDAHTTFPPEYIRRCVEGLLETGADNVGGPCITVPREPTLRGQAFATVLSHPFGVGNAHYKLGISQPMEVDAVPFGCMWRQKMLEIGPYDERIARSEDFGFNRKLRDRGGRMMLLPGIWSFYYARSRWRDFLRHSLSNGFWISYPLAFIAFRGSWRHYVPLCFLLALAGSAMLSLVWRPWRYLLGGIAAAYLLGVLAASVDAARRERRPGLVVLMPLVFAALHLAYGAGTLWGLVRAAVARATLRGAPAGGSARAT